jgi:hypothetical protein
MEVDEPGVGAPAGNRALDPCVVERLGKPESSGPGSCGRPRRRRGKCAGGRALARRVYSVLASGRLRRPRRSPGHGSINIITNLGSPQRFSRAMRINAHFSRARSRIRPPRCPRHCRQMGASVDKRGGQSRSTATAPWGMLKRDEEYAV